MLFETPGADHATWAGPPARRRPAGLIVAVVLLALGLVAAAGGAAWLFLQLQDASATIRDRDRELQDQRELIDRKDTFGAAVEALLGETAGFAGIPLASLIPWESYQALTVQAWDHRWDADQLDRSIAAVDTAREELAARRGAAEQEAAGNTTGSVYETVFDQLGSGFVTWRLDDADALCADDVLACVSSADPLIVHVDAPDDALPYMTDWIRTGIAYHEFAHVLQLTNPEPTEAALAAFDGDAETMADCFALTYLDGWSLEHRVWVSGDEYWDVSVGYGSTCDLAQRQVIRDWREGLGIQPRQLGAGVGVSS